MNKHICLGIGLAIGAVTGSVATFFFLDKRLKDIYEAELEDVKNVYEREKNRVKELVKENQEKRNKTLEDVHKSSNEHKESVTSQYVKYQSMFQNKPELEDLVHHDHPTENDFDEQGVPYDPDGTDLDGGYFDDEVPPEFEENYIAARPKDRGVYVLDDDEGTFTGDPMYIVQNLVYYEGDNTWTDELDEEVHVLDLFERQDIVDIVIEKLESQDAVYVKSNSTMVIYECTKIEGTFTYHVLGMKE